MREPSAVAVKHPGPSAVARMPAGHGAMGTAGKIRAGKWLLWQRALPARCHACFLLCRIRSEEKIL